MGRPLNGEIEPPKLVKSPKSPFWQISYHCSERHKRIEKSTGIKIKDRGMADEKLLQFCKRHRARAVTGIDMTFDDMMVRYLADNPQLNMKSHNSLWNPTKHITGPLQPADDDTVRILHKLRDDLLAGRADRRYTDPRGHPSPKPPSASVVNNLMGLHRRLIRHCCKATDAQGHPLFPSEFAKDKLILNTDKKQNFNPRKATNLCPTMAEFWQMVEIARTMRQIDEPDDGRLTRAYRLLMMFFHGGGQRSARVGALPWANINLTAAQPSISFVNIPGVRDDSKKKGIEKIYIATDGKASDPLDINFLAMLRRAHKERVKGPDGKLNPWFLDRRMTNNNVGYIVGKLYTAIGKDHGGGHSIRKLVATMLADTVGVGYASAVVGIGVPMLLSHYVKGHDERQLAGVKTLTAGLRDSMPSKDA